MSCTISFKIDSFKFRFFKSNFNKNKFKFLQFFVNLLKLNNKANKPNKKYKVLVGLMEKREDSFKTLGNKGAITSKAASINLH